MHAEQYVVDKAVCEAVARCRARSGRVVAVGTTTVRALESAATGGEMMPVDSEAELFIQPGFRFRVVDALLTNFHLPRSSLLVMVCAFAGRNTVMNAYRHAIATGYRFYSYGDAMMLYRHP